MPPFNSCLLKGLPYSGLEAFCRVPSTSFSQAPKYTLLIHLYRFRVRSNDGAISWNLFAANSIRKFTTYRFVATWLRNINLISIDYGFRPRLGCRLTLRGLTLRRNPWIFGEEVFFFIVTYVSIRTSDTSRIPHGYPFTGLQNVPLPLP